MDDPIGPIYSVSFRLQRTRSEVAFVFMPLISLSFD